MYRYSIILFAKNIEQEVQILNILKIDKQLTNPFMKTLANRNKNFRVIWVLRDIIKYIDINYILLIKYIIRIYKMIKFLCVIVALCTTYR